MVIGAVVAVLLSAPVLSAQQSLGEIARKTEESRNASKAATVTSSSPAMKLDQRDIDPRVMDPELLEYRFDQAKWDRLVAADVWTTQAVDKNPALYERLSGSRVQSIRALERICAREPALVAALQSAGTDAHEFAYASGAMAISMIIVTSEPSPEQLAHVPPAVKANVEFMRTHMAELKAMIARSMQLKVRMEKAARR